MAQPGRSHRNLERLLASTNSTVWEALGDRLSTPIPAATPHTPTSNVRLKKSAWLEMQVRGGGVPLAVVQLPDDSTSSLGSEQRMLGDARNRELFSSAFMMAPYILWPQIKFVRTETRRFLWTVLFSPFTLLAPNSSRGVS